MHRRTFLTTAASAALAAFLPFSAFAQSATDPAKFVADFAELGIVQVLEANITLAQKQDRFRALFNQYFDIPTIARFVMARNWRTLDETSQQRFVMLFEDIIVYTWSRRFSEYSGQTLRVGESAADGEEGAMVKSVILDKKGQSFAVDWRLRKRAETFKVVDIIIEGVSMAITYRQEYATVMQQNGGADGLFAQLEKQVADLKAASGA